MKINVDNIWAAAKRARPNKLAQGNYFTDERRKLLTGKTRVKTYEDMNNEQKMALNRLNLFGTMDLLKNGSSFLKKIKIQHPTDLGFYKEAYILSDNGKKRLKTVKRMREAKNTIWYYMSEPIILP